MNRWFRIGILLVAGIFSILRAGAQAQSEARLILDHTAVRPGGKAMAAVELKIPKGWHIYWRNPAALGGVGFAPKIEWNLPQGATADAIQWPLPAHLADPAGDAPAYVGSVWLLVPLSFDASLTPGELKLEAKLAWQECERECVRGQTNLTASIKIGPTDVLSFESGRFPQALSLLPTVGTNVKAQAQWDGPTGTDVRPLAITWETDAPRGEFFPYESKLSPLNGKPETSRREGGLLRLRHVVDSSDAGWPSVATGLLVEETTNGVRKGYEVRLPIADGPGVAVAATTPTNIAGLLPMLGLAFLGGLILNIMPCVLPVLALKILGFVRQAGSNPRHVRNLGLIYGMGVLTSFLVLGLVALGVQAAGSLAGWSTAFQNPQFRVLLCILLLLVALNLFGVFEVSLSGAALDETTHFARRTLSGPWSWIGGRGRGTGDSDTVISTNGLGEEGPFGAFFNGVLAAVLATPCTAPMLGTAIGFAFTQPPLILLLIFLTVGLGLATPFVFLCWRPQWLKWLPKPGGWMVRFKVAMGFPILGTCVWIFWFTATRMGSAGVLWLGLFLVTLSAAAWVWGEFNQRSGGSRWAVAVASVLVAAGYLGLLEGQLDWRHPASNRAPKLAWQHWSPAAVEAARKAGHPVLVDFTADNCLNCQINKKTSIEIQSTIELIKKYKVEVFEADYTDADPTIAVELQRYGRRGVPLVLIYSKKADLPPRDLPSILTPTIVHEALDWAGQ
jgi:thiol:disulfide interchange protein DsbD